MIARPRGQLESENIEGREDMVWQGSTVKIARSQSLCQQGLPMGRAQDTDVPGLY